MRWRDRFLFCAEAIYKSQAETGEIKGPVFFIEEDRETKTKKALNIRHGCWTMLSLSSITKFLLLAFTNAEHRFIHIGSRISKRTRFRQKSSS
jgi:hypothetical protein